MMFRPIKNFISYFQKSTNGAGIFVPTNSNVNETEMENDNMNSTTKVNNVDKKSEISGNNEESNIASCESSQKPNEENDISLPPKSPQKVSQQHDQNKNEVNEESIAVDNCVNETSIDIDLTTTIDSSSPKRSFDLMDFSTECSIKVDMNSKDSINIEIPSCSPTKICDPLAANSPTKIYVNGNTNYKSLNETNENSENELTKKLNDDDDDDDDVIVDEEIIVISPNENENSLTLDGSDPLAIDDCLLEENHVDLQPNSSILKNSLNDGIICIIDVDNIKDTGNMINGPKTGTNYNHLSKNISGSFDISNIKVEVGNEEQELRSDGSDSGLGLETSTLQIPPSTNAVTNFISGPLPPNKIPSKSNLKRRSNVESIISEKKTKRSIHFDGVNVYYFPRMQGFACVPSQGGCTLGMGARHVHYKTFSLTDYAAEQRRVHKQQMQEINPRSSSSDETDSDEEMSEASGSDLDADGSGFLQPVPARQRRALLKAAGIRKIDSTEKDECRAIRTSREFCGCSCRGYCDPDTCSCSQAGIKCQVDRPSFPCGCTRDGCANVVGRVEFNPGRVRTHFIHTIMRLEIEHKQKRRDEIDSLTMPMLNYMSNCVSSDNSNNLSITATLNTCSNSNNSLSNICNYNVSNTSHIGTQSYQHLHLQQQNNQNFLNTGHYSNMMHNNNGVSAASFSQDSIHDSNHQLMNNNCMRMMNNTSNGSHISNTLDLSLINSNSNHSMDLSYPIRDMTTENPMCSSLMIDFSTTSNQIFQHDIYNNQSYVSQSYQNNQNLNSNNSYHLTAAAYSNYQQNYLPYISQSCNNESIEIHDLATPDADDSNSYINLHPPTANSSRLDAINDLLHNNRNTPPTIPIVSSSSSSSNSTTTTTTTNIIDPLPMKPTTVSALSEICNLAPSAQTSTSIVEGTATKITPPALTISGKFESSSISPVVDLTDNIISSSKISTIGCNQDEQSMEEPLAILKDMDNSTESTSMRSSLNSKASNNDLMTSSSDLEKSNFEQSALNLNIISCDDVELIENKSDNKMEDNDDIQIVGISLDLDKISENENVNCNLIQNITTNEHQFVQNNELEKNSCIVSSRERSKLTAKCSEEETLNNTKTNLNEVEEAEEEVVNDENFFENDKNKKEKEKHETNLLSLLNHAEDLNAENSCNKNLELQNNENNQNNLILETAITTTTTTTTEENEKATELTIMTNDIILDTNLQTTPEDTDETHENEKWEQINSEMNTKSMNLSQNNMSISNNTSLNNKSSSAENDENDLADIIKKSIVETVSA